MDGYWVQAINEQNDYPLGLILKFCPSQVQPKQQQKDLPATRECFRMKATIRSTRRRRFLGLRDGQEGKRKSGEQDPESLLAKGCPRGIRNITHL